MGGLLASGNSARMERDWMNSGCPWVPRAAVAMHVPERVVGTSDLAVTAHRRAVPGKESIAQDRAYPASTIVIAGSVEASFLYITNRWKR
jgi:hypothetical protein